MTYSANKASHSEISEGENQLKSVSQLRVADFSAQYTILDKAQAYIIESPFDGFLNILFTDASHTCINPYFVNQHTFLIRGGENILHATKKEDQLEWKNTNEQNTAIVIFIPKDLIQEFSNKYDEQINRFRSGFLTKSDNRIALISNQILELHKQNGNLVELRMQSLLIDAIIHQIEGLFAENEQHEIIANKSHYDKIIMAKQLIEKDLSINYTIPELSKLVGTNEQYLKKYFKQYFGKTVMNYITEQKMNHAKELIMTGEYRVSDVARLTGYKHSTHFTTAFKKYFGFIPNSLKYTFLIASESTQHIITEIENIINIL